MTTPVHRFDPDARLFRSDALVDDRGTGSAALIHAAEADTLPTSFGVFKPVGHVMTGVQTQVEIDALVNALHGAGWPASAVRQFSPQDSVAELQAMVDAAGPMAGFGSEITLPKHYLALTEKGYRWLLVQADDEDRAAAVAQMARDCGATLAVHYRTLTVEDLIP